MFFKKLFSKEDRVIGVEINNIEKWLKEENEEFIKTFEFEVSQAYKSLQNRLLDLKSSLHELKNKEIPDVSEKLKRAAKTSKAEIEKDMEILFNSIRFPESSDYSSAFEFYNSVHKKIMNFGKKNKKNFIILGEALRDTRKLKKSLSDFEEELISLGEIVLYKGRKMREIENIVNLSKAIEKDKKRLEELRSKLKNLNSALEFQKDKLRETERKIEEIKESKDMKKFMKLRDAIKSYERKKSEIENRIFYEVQHFEKAFKKISSKQKVEMKYINSPLETLLEDSELKKFKEFLSSLKPLVMRGEFGLSEKVKEKFLSGVERVETGVLDWHIKEYREIKKKLNELEKKESKIGVTEEKVKREEEEKMWKQTIKATKEKIKEVENKIKELDKKIDSDIKTLEKKLNLFTGVKVYLKASSLN